MAGFAALGGVMGGAGVVAGAFAVFLAGPPLLVRAARALAVAGLALGAGGLLRELVASGFQLDMSNRGPGQGSLLAAGGMLMLTFGAARVAERRRATRDRERWMAAQRESRK